ncbi:putative uncharacterized protein DDB_G0282133 [Centruroides sculpturatus]|uniref:putative uncharacterized protein DDB_G0282133 n=1 Tax=Centruroides sculpturatus TaxID=218467 RepID=UPI000C6E8900|nr:putative uncharacterized protein DDB_G0282133 [Centruroides sculpturatus]
MAYYIQSSDHPVHLSGISENVKSQNILPSFTTYSYSPIQSTLPQYGYKHPSTSTIDSLPHREITDPNLSFSSGCRNKQSVLRNNFYANSDFVFSVPQSINYNSESNNIQTFQNSSLTPLTLHQGQSQHNENFHIKNPSYLDHNYWKIPSKQNYDMGQLEQIEYNKNKRNFIQEESINPTLHTINTSTNFMHPNNMSYNSISPYSTEKWQDHSKLMYDYYSFPHSYYDPFKPEQKVSESSNLSNQNLTSFSPQHLLYSESHKMKLQQRIPLSTSSNFSSSKNLFQSTQSLLDHSKTTVKCISTSSNQTTDSNSLFMSKSNQIPNYSVQFSDTFKNFSNSEPMCLVSSSLKNSETNTVSDHYTKSVTDVKNESHLNQDIKDKCSSNENINSLKDTVLKTPVESSFEPLSDSKNKAAENNTIVSNSDNSFTPIEQSLTCENESERQERLKNNIKVEVPQCGCFGNEEIPSEKAPYYTHLGTGPSVSAIRKLMEERSGEHGNAIRIEKLRYTGKEGKTSQGCPMAKWIIRRSGVEEKILTIIRHRPGHKCATAYIIIAIVVWEGVPLKMANELYKTVVYKTVNFGIPTQRRCAMNEQRTCACQGLDPDGCGASFSFGCSWSMYYNGCKFARSKVARKFKLSEPQEEQELEDKLQTLATHVSPLYKKVAPDSYNNQVVTLTKHQGWHKPDNEQLHVLPLYILDETDEFGSREGQNLKIKNGAIEVLHKYPLELRIRTTPLGPCRKRIRKSKAGANTALYIRKEIKQKQYYRNLQKKNSISFRSGLTNRKKWISFKTSKSYNKVFSSGVKTLNQFNIQANNNHLFENIKPDYENFHDKIKKEDEQSYQNCIDAFPNTSKLHIKNNIKIEMENNFKQEQECSSKIYRIKNSEIQPVNTSDFNIVRESLSGRKQLDNKTDSKEVSSTQPFNISSPHYLQKTAINSSKCDFNNLYLNKSLNQDEIIHSSSYLNSSSLPSHDSHYQNGIHLPLQSSQPISSSLSSSSNCTDNFTNYVTKKELQEKVLKESSAYTEKLFGLHSNYPFESILSSSPSVSCHKEINSVGLQKSFTSNDNACNSDVQSYSRSVIQDNKSLTLHSFKKQSFENVSEYKADHSNINQNNSSSVNINSNNEFINKPKYSVSEHNTVCSQNNLNYFNSKTLENENFKELHNKNLSWNNPSQSFDGNNCQTGENMLSEKQLYNRKSQYISSSVNVAQSIMTHDNMTSTSLPYNCTISSKSDDNKSYDLVSNSPVNAKRSATPYLKNHYVNNCTESLSLTNKCPSYAISNSGFHLPSDYPNQISQGKEYTVNSQWNVKSICLSNEKSDKIIKMQLAKNALKEKVCKSLKLSQSLKIDPQQNNNSDDNVPLNFSTKTNLCQQPAIEYSKKNKNIFPVCKYPKKSYLSSFYSEIEPINMTKSKTSSDSQSDNHTSNLSTNQHCQNAYFQSQNSDIDKSTALHLKVKQYDQKAYSPSKTSDFADKFSHSVLNYKHCLQSDHSSLKNLNFVDKPVSSTLNIKQHNQTDRIYSTSENIKFDDKCASSALNVKQFCQNAYSPKNFDCFNRPSSSVLNSELPPSQNIYSLSKSNNFINKFTSSDINSKQQYQNVFPSSSNNTSIVNDPSVYNVKQSVNHNPHSLSEYVDYNKSSTSSSNYEQSNHTVFSTSSNLDLPTTSVLNSKQHYQTAFSSSNNFNLFTSSVLNLKQDSQSMFFPSDNLDPSTSTINMKQHNQNIRSSKNTEYSDKSTSSVPNYKEQSQTVYSPVKSNNFRNKSVILNTKFCSENVNIPSKNAADKSVFSVLSLKQHNQNVYSLTKDIPGELTTSVSNSNQLNQSIYASSKPINDDSKSISCNSSQVSQSQHYSETVVHNSVNTSCSNSKSEINSGPNYLNVNNVNSYPISSYLPSFQNTFLNNPALSESNLNKNNQSEIINKDTYNNNNNSISKELPINCTLSSQQNSSSESSISRCMLPNIQNSVHAINQEKAGPKSYINQNQEFEKEKIASVLNEKTETTNVYHASQNSFQANNEYQILKNETPSDCKAAPEDTIYEVHSDSEGNFQDDEIGGVAIALTHGSILFECAKHELHATTALKNPNRKNPTRISLVFYQHKNLNYRNHGEAEWEKKIEAKRLEEVVNSSTRDLSLPNKRRCDEEEKQLEIPPTKQCFSHTTMSWATVFPIPPLIVTGPYQKWL